MWSHSRDGRLDEIVVFKFQGETYVPVGLLKVEGGGARRSSDRELVLEALTNGGRPPWTRNGDAAPRPPPTSAAPDVELKTRSGRSGRKRPKARGQGGGDGLGW